MPTFRVSLCAFYGFLSERGGTRTERPVILRDWFRRRVPESYRRGYLFDVEVVPLRFFSSCFSRPGSEYEPARR